MEDHLVTARCHSHCSCCGAAFADSAPWPRTCVACGQTTYLNPTPVAVMLLPVDDGLLVIRRAIEPQLGQLALPGGYIDFGESWQEACARELREETGIVIDPAEVALFDVHSADATVLIFGGARSRAGSALPAFAANPEVSERTVILKPESLAFPLHTRAAADWFARR